MGNRAGGTRVSAAIPEIAVLGSQGQLGRELLAILPPSSTVSLTRSQADLSIPGQITAYIQQFKPRVVINCTAYNLVDLAEDQPTDAFAVNSLGVRELALACRDAQSILIHFSTDYVFGLDSQRNRPYVESDEPGPISVYGVSKLAGEYFVRSLSPKHYVIRTCGLYGKYGTGGKGTNFVETMRKLGASGKPVRVVSDQILTPTSASDLARAVVQLLETDAYGLYHLTNAGYCSWYEFAHAIFELTRVSVDLQPTTSAEYRTRARRPAYSVLNSGQLLAPRLRPWKEALLDYLCSSPVNTAPE